MRHQGISRRSWLKTTAAAGGASLVAGCGGDGTSDEETEYPVPDETVDKTYVTNEFNEIHNINYNPFDSLYFPNQSTYYLFNQLMDEVKTETEGTLSTVHFPNLAEDWTRDGDVFTLFIDDRYTWHNGDPVTADDVAIRFTLDKLMDRRAWRGLFEDLIVEDEFTLTIETTPDAHDELLLDVIEGPPGVVNHPDVYGEFLPEDGSRGKQAYEDMSSFKQTQLRGDLLSLTVQSPVGEGTENNRQVLGNGPWKMVRHSEREMIYEPHEGHPFADRLNFERVKFVEFTTNQARYQALLGGQFSGLDLVLTQTVMDQLPPYWEQYPYDRRLGHGLAMNYDRFPDHRVRQAIAFALDKENIVENSGLADDLVKPHEEDSAVYANHGVQVRDFGDGFLEQLTIYDQDLDRAARLLREAGWTKRGDWWYDADGEKAEYTIKVPPTWTEFVNMVQTEAQHLTDFGIDTDFRTEELVVYYGQTMIQVDYDMAHWWVGGARGFPWFGYNVIWNALQTIGDKHNHPEVYENVPGPIGEHNGDDTFRYNWQEGLNELAKSRFDSDRAQEIRRKLGWTYNQMMPVYCLHHAGGMGSLDSRHWSAPDPNEKTEPHGDTPGSHFFPLNYIHNRVLMQATSFQG